MELGVREQEGPREMDGTIACGSVSRCRGAVRVGWVYLAAALIVVSGGCAATDQRISLGEFMRAQEVSADLQPKAAVWEVPFEPGQYLGPYRVGPGDVLEVQVTGPDGAALFPPLPARIDHDGEIELPIAGSVKVGDMELTEVEDAIRQAFAPAVVREAVCHAALSWAEATNVLVTGAALQPGVVALRRTERNLLFALAGAGGVRDEASGHVTLRRIRAPGEELTLDLTDPAQLREALMLDPLDPGDILYVHPAQPNTIFVGGLVNRAGPQSYATGAEITALQALAAASGLRTDVTPKEGTLVRRMPDGTDAFVKLDLQRLATGTDPNIVLAAGDVLWVPDTWETRVQDFINRNIFLRAGVSVNYNVTGIEFLNRRSQQSQRYGGGGLQDAFDPFGFLGQNTLLQGLATQPQP